MAGGTSMTGALQAQIDRLTEQITEGFRDMKVMIQGIDDRVRKIEQTEAGCLPVINEKLAQAFNRLEDHGMRIVALEKAMGEIAATNKILRWILGVLTAAVVALLVALVTGKAMVVFP